MTIVKSYESPEAMFADLARAREAADARVLPMQEDIKIGDCFIRYAPEADLVIYGEVIDPLAFYEGKDLDADDGELRAEKAYEEKLRAEPHMKNFRFSKCYSVACEDGELGDVHVSTMLPIPRKYFEAAQRLTWPMRRVPVLRTDATEDERIVDSMLDLLFQAIASE